jgi:hypothetical protein
MNVNLNIKQENTTGVRFVEEGAVITGNSAYAEFVSGNLPRKERYLVSEKQAGKEKKDGISRYSKQYANENQECKQSCEGTN